MPDANELGEAEAAQTEIQNEQQNQQRPQQRPQSILGGFVRSLAKSVALPEEDPSLYHDMAGGAAPPVVAPALYHREDVVRSHAAPPAESFPRLYNAPREQVAPVEASKPPSSTYPSAANDTRPRDTTTVTPQLYTGNHSESLAEQREKTPPTTSTNLEGIMEVSADGDGWDEDIILDDNDDLQADGANEPETPQPSYQYDPITDIIPTRKRWVHPNHHGCRSLYALSLIHISEPTRPY